MDGEHDRSPTGHRFVVVFAARVASFDDFFQLVPDVAKRVRRFGRGEVDFLVFVGAHERQKLFSASVADERFAED